MGKHFIDLVIRGLFSPGFNLQAFGDAGLYAPGLSRLLTHSGCRADVPTNADSLLRWLVSSSDGEFAGGLGGDAGSTPAAQTVRADPVFFELGGQDLFLRQIPQLLSLEVKVALEAALNAHLATVGASFFWGELENAGYIALPERRPLDVEPPSALQGRSVRLPAGNNAVSTRFWRGLLTDLQMISHACLSDGATQPSAGTVVNGFWIWGGHAVPEMEIRYSALMGKSEFLARLSTRTEAAWNECFTPERCLKGPSLFYCEDLFAAGEQASSWLHALSELDRRCFSPLAHALRERRIGSVRIFDEHGRVFESRRPGVLSWRRRAKPLHSFLEG